MKQTWEEIQYNAFLWILRQNRTKFFNLTESLHYIQVIEYEDYVTEVAAEDTAKQEVSYLAC